MSPFGKPRASQRFGIYRFEVPGKNRPLPPCEAPTLLADAETLGEALAWVCRHYNRLLANEHKRARDEGAVGVEVFDWLDGQTWQMTRIA